MFFSNFSQLVLFLTMTLFAATFFLLLLLGTSTAIPWKKYVAIPEQQQLVTNPVPLFLQVFAPKEPALVFLPLYSNYVVYSLPFLTEYVELCAMGDALLVNCSQHLHLLPNAENFNNTMLLNATMGSLVQNYCRYCITERRSVADFEQTRHLYSNATSNDCGNGNLAFFVDKLYNRSNICYCPMMDKYGYQCDGYTQVGYTFAWEVFKYAVLVIAAFLMTLTILLLWIPECCVRCKLAKRDFHWCTKLSHFVQIQMHCVLFLSCDYLLMILDQILGLSYHSQSGTLLRSSRFAVGTFRLVAYFFVLLAYATTLIKWGNVFARSQEMRSGAALNLTHTYVLFWLTFGRILVIVYYVIVAICVLVLGIVYLVFSEPRILYLVAGSMLFLFFVVFPVGFSFYALRIYYTLRATKSSSKRVCTN